MLPADELTIAVTGDVASGLADWLPPVDILETPTAFEIALELCGVVRDDVQVGFREGRLTVWGTRRPDTAGEALHYRERRTGRFVRAFSFRTPVDGGRIAARLRQGVLALTVPKRQPRRIPLASGG